MKKIEKNNNTNTSSLLVMKQHVKHHYESILSQLVDAYGLEACRSALLYVGVLLFQPRQYKNLKVLVSEQLDNRIVRVQSALNRNLGVKQKSVHDPSSSNISQGSFVFLFGI